MTRRKPLTTISVAAVLLTLVALSSAVASAQSAKLEGVIKGRSGSEIIWVWLL